MECKSEKALPEGAMEIIASTMEFVLSNLPGRSRMRLRIGFYFLMVMAILGVSSAVFAHHGNAAYETSKAVELKGATVTKFVWGNPHTFLMFDVKDDKGNVVHWAGEAGSPSSLGLLGWTKESVQPGDIVTVYIYQSKTGRPVGRLNRIVLADGTALKDSALGYREQ
jgi:hypothetical protein